MAGAQGDDFNERGMIGQTLCLSGGRDLSVCGPKRSCLFLRNCGKALNDEDGFDVRVLAVASNAFDGGGDVVVAACLGSSGSS